MTQSQVTVTGNHKAYHGEGSFYISSSRTLRRRHRLLGVSKRLKLNKDKTELIWIGTEKSLQRLPSRGILLTYGGDHIAVADNARVLDVFITSDLSFDSVSLLSVTSASFSCDSCVGFAVHTMTRQSPCTRSSPQESTTATVCWLTHRQALTCHERCRTSLHQHTEVWPRSDARPTSRSPWAVCHWPHQVPTVRQRIQMSTWHVTRLISVRRKDNIFALLVVDIFTCWGSGWQPSDDVRSLVLRYPHETFFYHAPLQTLFYHYFLFQKQLFVT